MNPPSPFACISCKQDYDWDKNVILPNRKWLWIAESEDHLCSDCIEKRLGRKIKPSDFPNRPVSVYKGQRINLRTIPINQIFFKAKGWDLTTKRIRK